VEELYNEECVALQVIFNFTSAIRYNKSLLVDGAVVDETMYGCPDEGWACPGTNDDGSVYVTCGCPYTAWFQCALTQIEEGDQRRQEKQVTFIACWDDQGLADKKQTNETLEAAASTCSQKIGVDWDAVQACNGDYAGKRAELLFAAASRYMDKWPENRDMGGRFDVPHVLIGNIQSDMTDMDVEINSKLDIPAFNDLLCSFNVQTGTCAQTIIA